MSIILTILIIFISFISLIFLSLVYINYGRKSGLNKEYLSNNFNPSTLTKISPWYQFQFIPNWFQKSCKDDDVIAEYTQDAKDKKKINVKNTCIRKKDGKKYTLEGSAYFYKDNMLKVTIPKYLSRLSWIDKSLQKFGDYNFVSGDYYIIKTDNENYLVVGSANLKYLWILVKDKNYFLENPIIYRRVIRKIAKAGYNKVPGNIYNKLRPVYKDLYTQESESDTDS